MTDAQMAFLAERRRARELEQQQNERSNNALPAESPGNGSTKYNGYGAFLDDNDDDDGLAVSSSRLRTAGSV